MMRRTIKTDWLEAKKHKRRIYKNLIQNDFFMEVWDRAQEKEVLQIDCPALLRWNFFRDGDDPIKANESPRENGSWDIEGHPWADIIGFKKDSLLTQKGIKNLIKRVLKWLYEDVWLLLTDGKITIKKIKKDFLYIIKTHPFKLTTGSCTWTISSLKAEALDACWEHAKITAIAKGMIDPNEDDLRSSKIIGWTSIVNKLYEEMLPFWDKKDTIKYLQSKGNMIKCNDWLWVEESDPTTFIVDEIFIPFDMKDGWSEDQLCFIIQEWCKELLGEQPKVCFMQSN